MLGVVVVLYHPVFELGDGFRHHPAVAGCVGEIFDVCLEIAGEEGVCLSEDRHQNDQLLAWLLPLGGIGLVAEGGFELFGAVVAEIYAVSFTVLEEIGAAFALGLLGTAIVVEGGLVAAEDMDSERIVGGVLAFGV